MNVQSVVTRMHVVKQKKKTINDNTNLSSNILRTVFRNKYKAFAADEKSMKPIKSVSIFRDLELACFQSFDLNTGGSLRS